jgi:hypothetical protein
LLALLVSADSIEPDERESLVSAVFPFGRKNSLRDTLPARLPATVVVGHAAGLLASGSSPGRDERAD